MSSKSKADQEVVSNTPSTIELTAYQQGPAVIRETRQVSLGEGRSKLAINGLPLQFVPGSLTVVSASGAGNFKMISTSFRAANLSMLSILAKAVGTHVILREDSARGLIDHTGKLLYVVDNRTAVLQESDDAEAITLVPLTNKIELTEGMPDGLSALSSLAMDIEASATGQYALKSLYESEGVNWRPWYEIFYDRKKGALTRFACYVELSNNSGTDFDDAGIKLIAGANHSVNAQPRNRGGMRAMALESAMPMAATAGGGGDNFDYESADVESVGEQKMYSLPDRVSLENGETQNPALVFAAEVPVDHEYYLDAGWYGPRRQESEDDLPKLPIKVKLRLKNSAASNLGVALPPGRVRVLEPDQSGQLQKTDSSIIGGHVAKNEKFSLDLGNPARDLKATRELAFQHIDPVPTEDEEEVVSEGPHPIQPMVGLEGGVTAGPAVHNPGKVDMARRSAVKKAADDDQTEAPRFQEEERIVRLFNYGDEDAEVTVHENIPPNAEFIKDDIGFTRFSDASQSGAYKVTIPAGTTEDPGEVSINYRIKWQIN